MNSNSFFLGMWTATIVIGLVALAFVMIPKVCGG